MPSTSKYRIPSAWCKFNIYHQRVSMKLQTNIFMCRKTTIFFPASINLFRGIINKWINCSNVFIPTFNKIFLVQMGTKVKLIFLFKLRWCHIFYLSHISVTRGQDPIGWVDSQCLTSLPYNKSS